MSYGLSYSASRAALMGLSSGCAVSGEGHHIGEQRLWSAIRG